MPVETLFPQRWKCFEWGSSGWPWVLGVDAIGGPPHGDFANECSARAASRQSPEWLIVGSGGEVSNLAGEVGDVLCSLDQVVTPGGMGLNRVWNVWEPGQRSCCGCRECCEVTFNQHGQRNEDDRRRVEPPIEVESATWSAGGTLDWWVKERQVWWGRVYRRDGRQVWIKAADLRPAEEE